MILRMLQLVLLLVISFPNSLLLYLLYLDASWCALCRIRTQFVSQEIGFLLLENLKLVVDCTGILIFVIHAQNVKTVLGFLVA